MYRRNRTCPRTVPWGTPETTGSESDDAPSRTTLWELPERKSNIHSRVFPLMLASAHETVLYIKQLFSHRRALVLSLCKCNSDTHDNLNVSRAATW